MERSSDQVIKPVNLEALSRWVGAISSDVIRDMADIAPMLSVLGYNPYANPPSYGNPDDQVKDNTLQVKKDEKMWKEKAHDLLQKDSPFDNFHPSKEDNIDESVTPNVAW